MVTVPKLCAKTPKYVDIANLEFSEKNFRHLTFSVQKTGFRYWNTKKVMDPG
jgi:hypothetical protein